MMPQSSQNLYFHLGMNADDDGFCEHFTIMRMTESKPDDLRILQAKNFIQVFDDKVLVITDWKENNYLRSDRYTPSKYLDIYKKEIKKIGMTIGIPNDDQTGDGWDTQDRIGKDRIGKNRIKKERQAADSPSPLPEIKKEYTDLANLLYAEHLNHDDKFLAGKDLDKTFNRWANDIRLLIESDKRDPGQVKAVILWCQSAGCFWVPNILSGKKLREKFPTLYTQMNEAGKPKGPEKRQYEKDYAKVNAKTLEERNRKQKEEAEKLNKMTPEEIEKMRIESDRALEELLSRGGGDY